MHQARARTWRVKASNNYEQGNTLTVRWVPGHRGAMGGEVADTFAKEAASERTPGNKSRRASFLRRRAAEKATGQSGEHVSEFNRGKRINLL
jgi:ribonuclease HI